MIENLGRTSFMPEHSYQAGTVRSAGHEDASSRRHLAARALTQKRVNLAVDMLAPSRVLLCNQVRQHAQLSRVYGGG
jgi:hypothetical protein